MINLEFPRFSPLKFANFVSTLLILEPLSLMRGAAVQNGATNIYIRDINEILCSRLFIKQCKFKNLICHNNKHLETDEKIHDMLIAQYLTFNYYYRPYLQKFSLLFLFRFSYLSLLSLLISLYLALSHPHTQKKCI